MPHKLSENLLPNCRSNNLVFQGEIGLPGPPGHDGEKVRQAASVIALPFSGLKLG